MHKEIIHANILCLVKLSDVRRILILASFGAKMSRKISHKWYLFICELNVKMNPDFYPNSKTKLNSKWYPSKLKDITVNVLM